MTGAYSPSPGSKLGTPAALSVRAPEVPAAAATTTIGPLSLPAPEMPLGMYAMFFESGVQFHSMP